MDMATPSPRRPPARGPRKMLPFSPQGDLEGKVINGEMHLLAAGAGPSIRNCAREGWSHPGLNALSGAYGRNRRAEHSLASDGAAGHQDRAYSAQDQEDRWARLLARLDRAPDDAQAPYRPALHVYGRKGGDSVRPKKRNGLRISDCPEV